MRQEKYNFINIAFSPKVFSYSFIFILAFICSELRKAQAEAMEIPGLAIARFALPSIPTSTETVNSTGTAVGEKIIQFKKALKAIEADTGSIIQSTRDLYEKAICDINEYHLILGEIEAKLQLGTTPSNPKLIDLRNKALQQLDLIAGKVGVMNGLTERFSKNSQQTKALASQTAAAFRLPGAIDEDHANLILISDELANIESVITRIMTIVSANTQRQSEWLRAERVHFANLSSAIDRGQSSIASQHPPCLALIEAHPSPKKASSSLHEKLPTKVKTSAAKSTPKPTSQPITNKAEAKTLPLLIQEKPQVQNTRESSLQSQQPEPISSKAPPASPQPEIPVTLASKPLPITKVTPHPKIQPLSDAKDAPKEVQASPSGPYVLYSVATKGRSPLGLIEASQEPRKQKWYLFSSAKRGLRAPTDTVEIVHVLDKDNSPARGKEVVSLLLEMGLKPEQVRLIISKGEEDQAGVVYIFGK